MAVTVAELQEYVNAPDADQTFLEKCLAVSVAIIDQKVGSKDVPAVIRNQAVLEVAAEQFHRRSAPNGIAQFATPDTPGMRIARDPYTPAAAILSPYIGLGTGGA
jgi:hypothetical protein